MAAERATDGLRVLHLIDHSVPFYSGYSFRSRYVIGMLRDSGCAIEVVTSARHDGFERDVEEVDGILHHRTARPRDLLSRAQLRVPFWRETVMTRAMAVRLEEVARRFRPHVIHAHSPFFDGQAALRVGARLGVPVIYEIRAFWEDDAVDKGKIAGGGFVYRQVQRLETAVVRRADRVVCICEGLRTDLIARGIRPEKILISKNGVEIDAFQPRARDEELARSYGLEGKRVVGFIGSFFTYEGLPELVAAAARLGRERSDFKLLLIGAGDDEPRVKAAIARNGAEDLVVMPGRVPHDRIAAHYALVDVFVYPREKTRLTDLVTPLKPLEALAMERIVLGSDVGGIRELLDECEVGRVFRAGSVEDMARAIGETLDRAPADLAEEGKKGRRMVAERRAWSRNVLPVLEAYRELSGKAPQPVASA